MNKKMITKFFITILVAVMIVLMIIPQEVMGIDITNENTTKESGTTLNKSSITLNEGNEEQLYVNKFSNQLFEVEDSNTIENELDEDDTKSTLIKDSVYDNSIEVLDWENSNPKAVALEKNIEDGTYYIKSAVASNKNIDIKGSSKENKATVQLWNKNNSIAQRFYIKSIENGYYTITAKCSNKALDVTGKGQEKGTKVQQYATANTDAQKWEFEYAGNGYYYIKSKCNGLYLDVKGGKTANGTQIQMWTENRNNSQKFKLEPVEKTIKNGVYYLKSALNTKKTIDIKGSSKDNKAKVQLYSKNNTKAQKFEIRNIENDLYTITAKCSNKALEVAGASKAKGTMVKQNTASNKNEQKWYLENAGNGYYYIKSKCNGLYLDVKGGKTANGTSIQVWTSNKSNSQKFKLELVEKITDEMEEGSYTLKTALDESKAISVLNDSTDKGEKIVISNYDNKTMQQFQFTSIGNGYYFIRTKKGENVLDVVGGNVEEGTNIQQWSLNGSDAQIWKLENAGNGYYYIKSKKSGLYLNVANNEATDGNQLEIWPSNREDSQKFKIEKINNKEEPERVTVKPKCVGTAVITAKLSNGEKATCTVTVPNIKYKSKVVFYSPHQDDETLYFGQTVLDAIKERGADNVYVVLLSNGNASKVKENETVKTKLNNMEITFSEARDNEFRAACKELGIKNIIFSEDIGVTRQNDSEVMASTTKEIMEYFEESFNGDVTHLTYSYYEEFEPHSDHRAAGQALKELYDANKSNSSYSSVYFIIKALNGKKYDVPNNKLITIFSRKNTNAELIKIYNALQKYKVENKNEGIIGIGHRSVRQEMDRVINTINNNNTLITQIHFPY